MKKRVLFCLLLTAFALALTACNNVTPTADVNTETSTVSQQQISVDKPKDIEEIHEEKMTAKERAIQRMKYAYEGKPQYQIALEEGRVDPKTPKLSYDDVKEIIKEVTDEIPDDGKLSYLKQGEEILKRIRDIQRSADLYIGGYNSFSEFIYWPDANTVEERRTSILVHHDYGFSGDKIIYYVYDDNNEIISEEMLYDATVYTKGCETLGDILNRKKTD